jgi:hypothetical protein
VNEWLAAFHIKRASGKLQEKQHARVQVPEEPEEVGGVVSFRSVDEGDGITYSGEISFARAPPELPEGLRHAPIFQLCCLFSQLQRQDVACALTARAARGRSVRVWFVCWIQSYVFCRRVSCMMCIHGARVLAVWLKAAADVRLVCGSHRRALTAAGPAP